MQKAFEEFYKSFMPEEAVISLKRDKDDKFYRDKYTELRYRFYIAGYKEAKK